MLQLVLEDADHAVSISAEIGNIYRSGVTVEVGSALSNRRIQVVCNHQMPLLAYTNAGLKCLFAHVINFSADDSSKLNTFIIFWNSY